MYLWIPTKFSSLFLERNKKIDSLKVIAAFNTAKYMKSKAYVKDLWNVTYLLNITLLIISVVHIFYQVMSFFDLSLIKSIHCRIIHEKERMI